MAAAVLDDTTRTGKRELLWVEQDSVATSPALKSGPRNRRVINSHVQRFSKTSQQLTKARDPDANHAPFLRWKLVKSTDTPTPSESSRRSSSDKASIPPSLEVSRSSGSQQPPQSSHSGPVPIQPRLLLPSIGFTGGSIDPFNMTIAKLDASVLELLHYYIHVLVPSKWHVDSQSNQKLARIESASRGVIRGCLADELHMYSLLASMASRTQNLEHWSLAPQTDLYIHRALVALRRYIDAKPAHIETQVFYDMFFLCTAEAYRENLEASMTHLRAIAQLVEVEGGLNQLDNHMLLETLVQGDIMLAVEQLSQPVFPLTWETGPFPHARWEVIKLLTPLQDLGQAVLEDATLHPPLRTIIHDVVQCVQVAQYVWTHPQSSKSDLEWIFLRYLAILHRLLTHNYISRPRTEGFRIALIMWIMIVMTSLGIRRAVKRIVPQLKLALLAAEREAQEKDCCEARNGLMLWVLTIGSFASDGTPDEQWFVARLAAVMRQLHLRTAAQLRGFLSHYFYLDSAQSASLGILVLKLSKYVLVTLRDPEPLTLRGHGRTEEAPRDAADKLKISPHCRAGRC